MNNCPTCGAPFPNEDWDWSDHANTSLIAAAPELLAACKDALDYFLSTGHGSDWRQGGGTEHELLAAAIAKAEGRDE